MSNWTVEAWNARVPVGFSVRYWPGIRDGEGREGITRAPAWDFNEGRPKPLPVTMIHGLAGVIALTHVEPVDPLPEDDTP